MGRLKKFFYISLFLFTSIFILERRGIFIPEVALAASCKPFSGFESGKTQVNLIELYTSEGCSSCPPAEKWLNSLYAKPGLYKEFVPIAFHVDYWDYIGHPDPLASSAHAQRQRKYALEWSAPNIYTPGFVLNGRDWRSLRRKLPSAQRKKVGNLIVKKRKAEEFSVSYSTTGDYDFYGALLLHGIENKIRKGENSGKTLKHNFVVNQLVKRGEGAIFKFQDPKIAHQQKSIVFWVSKKGSLSPLQVAGHCL